MNYEGHIDMQQPMLDRRVAIDNLTFRMHSLDIPMSWSNGAIKRPEIEQSEYQILVDLLPEAVVTVIEENLSKSGCTDGRVRMERLDGSDPEDWQKTVGADGIEMFIAAETLGTAFYGSSLDKAPVMDRFNYVLEFMKKNGLTPTTHEECGARAGFVTVLENGISYAADMKSVDAIAKRISVFSNANIPVEEINEVTNRWSVRDLRAYDESKARTLIIQHGGESAVEILHTDSSSPTHGHTEASILRINAPGMTFSTRIYQSLLQQKAPQLAHLEAFSVNDDRINEKLAPTIADDNNQLSLARTAMHLFGDAGHATLSTDLPTYVLKKVA